MEIEQLKLILEALQGVGHEAGNLAVLYLWLKFGSAALSYLTATGGILGIGWLILRAIRMCSDGDASERFLCEMRDQLRIGISGCLTDGERQRTTDAIRALVAEKRAKEKNT